MQENLLQEENLLGTDDDTTVAQAPVTESDAKPAEADPVVETDADSDLPVDLPSGDEDTDDAEFDPLAAIEHAEAQPDQQGALVDQTDALYATTETEGGSDVAKTLASMGTFGQLDTADFSDLKVQDVTPVEGVYVFALEQRFLQEATRIINQVGSISRSSTSALKVTLFEDRVRLSAFNQSTLCEKYVPAFQPIANHKIGDKEVSFIFDQGIMSNISQSFGDAVIQFSFHAAKQLVEITSGETVLTISTIDPADFIDYQSRIGDLRLLSRINPDALGQALKYSALFAKKDNVQLNLSLVDFRGNRALSGNTAAIGVAKYRDLLPEGVSLDMPIKYDVLKIVQNVCKYLDKEGTYLYETDNYFILRDNSTYFGFERISFSFPPVDAFFNLPIEDRILIPRGSLVNSLMKLSVVATDNNLLVSCSVSGNGSEAVLKLTTRDAAGKESVDRFAVHRTHKGGDVLGGDLSFDVFLHYLSKVVNHFDAANLNLGLMGTKAIMVQDVCPDGTYECSSILPQFTQEQAKALAAKEAAE